MSIVSGNEPPQRRRGSNWSWLIFLLIVFGPTVIGTLRPFFNDLVNVDQGQVNMDQVVIIAGGVLALAVLVLLVARVRSAASRTPSALPTTYTPPTGTISSATNTPMLPTAPRFEPIITGKVVLAGVLLLMLLAGAALLFGMSL